jgi:hypothetical protein
MNCPECGAADGECETRYHECLAKEFEDPRFGTVHHLSVATYMLQHSSKLSGQGWLYERALLRAFLVENKTPALIREQNRDSVDSLRREFKIASRDGRPVIRRAQWTRTILDVSLADAEIYCRDVTAWAWASLHDVETLPADEVRDNER